MERNYSVTVDELLQQIIAKHRQVYDDRVPNWKGFGISCWFGDGQTETVKYYYDLPSEKGKQTKTPSVYDEFHALQQLMPDRESVHAIILGYVRDTESANLRIIRDAEEAEKYQNWLSNPFDIAAAIRPDGV